MRILVTDDVETDRLNIKVILEKLGYMVNTASSGEECLKKAQELKPEIIFLDIIMGGMNGFQVCRELKRNPNTKDIPVILVSSKDQKADLDWARQQGAIDFIGKPAREEDVLRVLGKLMKIALLNLRR